MKNVFISILICSLYTTAKSEIIIPLSTFDLCVHSDLVVEAKLMRIENENFVFQYIEFNGGSKQYKRITIPNLNNRYDIEGAKINRIEIRQLESQLKTTGLNLIGLDTVSLDNADKIIMFLNFSHEVISKPILNGIRLVKNSIIYSPTQRVIPGKLSFTDICKLGEDEFNRILIDEIESSEKLKAIIRNSNQNSQHTKISLRKWLNTYVQNTDQSSIKGSDCVDWQKNLLGHLINSKEGDNLERKVEQITIDEIRNLY